MTDNGRVEYIDLMKGFAIILVVIHHCYITSSAHIFFMLSYIRMPLYIFLSGLFFKTYNDSFKVFVTKKINRYILPMIFFMAIYMLIFIVAHQMSWLDLKGYLYRIVVKCDFAYANFALWFFKLLFWLAMLGFIFDRLTRRCHIAIKIAIPIAISALIFALAKHGIISVVGKSAVISLLFQLVVFQSLLTFPIYYIPSLFRDKILKTHNITVLTTMFVVAIITLYFTAEHYVELFWCDVGDHYLLWAISQICGVYCFYYLGYTIKHLPYVSYMGRYSIVVLGTHVTVHYITRNLLHITDLYINAAIILATAPLLIWVLIRIAPHFTAQKDLLKVDASGKLQISFKD